LIGGLNGRGKTTFLDAIQLVLYGKSANCSNRGTLAYDQFLSKCRNRSAKPSDTTSLELTFSHASGGKVSQYRVRRSWDGERALPKEQIRVWVDGSEDPFLAESWSDHVEGLVPIGVSQLFFFDGEKIEQLADPKNAPQILGTGINSLLGLDIVDRLSSDLSTFEKRSANRSGNDVSSHIVRGQSELDELATLHGTAAQELASLQQQADFCRKEIHELEASYQARGGKTADERAAILDEKSRVEAALEILREGLLEHAAGQGPLLLIRPLLDRVKAQAEAERRADENALLQSILEKRDTKIISIFKKSKIDPTVVKYVSRALEADREEKKGASKIPRLLSLSRQSREEVSSIVKALPEAAVTIKLLLREYRSMTSKLDLIDRRLASAPSHESLADLIAKIATKRKELGTLEGQLEQKQAKSKSLANELERQTAVVRNLRQKALHSTWAVRDQDRILVHSSRVKLTLEQFKHRILLKHIERIETFILESLKLLFQKQTLVSGVKINPGTLELSLLTETGDELHAERLSAGERQLLAVSLLWGLGKASGRTLPTIIDTPLGRLDSQHRNRLVEQYFPQASHQVILLSTDEEINGAYLRTLVPKISRTYLIDYSESSRSSSISTKYFSLRK
jgi:DNA sulfur modification protein DndD